MLKSWIISERLFDGRNLLRDVALELCNGHVQKIIPSSDLETSPDSGDVFELQGLLCPGFVDLQVNGGGGALLNATPTSEAIKTIAKAHRKLGSVAILPTVISDSVEVLEQAATAMLESRSTAGVIGLHIEGPHIAMSRRGTHRANHLRPMDDRTLQVVSDLRAAKIPVMITLAPDVVSCEQIKTLVSMGAIVSVGHSDATAQTVRDAINAGLNCATHMFNAMSPMLGREPGVVGAVINSNCYSGIICDGHHVADEMVGMAIRARPQKDLMFLVSDAMATVGGPDHFTLYGEKISLVNGKLINAEGSLAGAHVTQAQGVKRLVDNVGLSVTEALRMATYVPANCIMRPDLGQLIGRPLEDILLLKDDLTLNGSLDMVLPSPSS